MSSGRQERWTHEDFVMGRGPELVRLAYAVSSDPQVAHDAVVRALTTVGRDWTDVLDSGSPLREGRRAVLREVLRAPRSASAFGFSPTAAVWDEEGDAETDSPRAAVLRAYAALDPADRAVLALSVLEGLDSQQVAEATGETVSSVASRGDRGLATLTTARGAAAPPSRREPSVPVEADLREALHQAVADAHLDTDVLPPVTARATSRRRRTRRLSAAGLAVVVLAGGATAATTLAGGHRVGTALSTGTVKATPMPTATTGYASWAPRGALARDPQLLSAITRFGVPQWLIDSRSADAGRGTVVWADRVGDEVVAVVAYPFFDATSTVLTGTALSYFRGPEPGLVTRLEFRSDLDAQDVIAFTTSSSVIGSLVVIGPPSLDDLELSVTLSYSLDGRVKREDWSSLPTRDGVAVVPHVPGAAFAARVRTPTGAIPVQSLTDGSGSDDDTYAPLLRLPARASNAEVDARLVTVTTANAAALARVSPTLISTRVLASVSLAGDQSPGYFAPGDTERVVVLLSRLPSGAVLRSAYVHQVGIGEGSRAVTLELTAPIPAKDAARRPFVAVAPSPDGSTTSALVIAPGASWVTLLTDDGAEATTAVRSGVARLPASLSAGSGAVITYDADRRKTGSWEWPSLGEQDPLADTG